MVFKNQQFDHSTESNCGLWIGPMWGRVKAFHGFPIWMRSWTPATIRCFDVNIRGTVEGMGWRTLITKFRNDFMWSIVGINMYIINHKTSFHHIIIQLHTLLSQYEWKNIGTISTNSLPHPPNWSVQEVVRGCHARVRIKEAKWGLCCYHSNPQKG